MNKAISFLFLIVLFFLCFGEYAGIETIDLLSQQAVKSLPFGDYLWEIYLSIVSSPESTIIKTLSQSIPNTFLDFSRELTQLVVTWLIYSMLVKNIIDILIAANTAGTETIFDKINRVFFEYLGFVVSSLGSAIVIKFIDNLFLELGTSTGTVILQTVVYWILSLGIAAIIIFVLLGKQLIKEAIKTIINSITMLIVTAVFFMIAHYLGATHTISLKLILILIIGFIVTVITDKKVK